MPKNNRLIDFAFELAMSPLHLVPYPVIHNLEKALTLKKVFWHVALERLPGGYFEFGVASGNSISSARRAMKASQMKNLGVMRMDRKIHGFDTFSGFKTSDDSDTHSTWVGDKFSFDFAAVKKRFASSPEVTLHAVNAEDLANHETAQSINEILGEDLCAVAMLDMDLGAPTYHALNFLAPRIQKGTILIFDEFFAYLGDPAKGEAGALGRFLEENPEFLLRELTSYGDGGKVFQVHQTPRSR